MKHAWKQPKKITSKTLVPIDQHAAMLSITMDNAVDFATQLTTELGMLALNRAFGFGRKRAQRFKMALAEELLQFTDLVEWEFSAETLGMTCREKGKARPDLAYTLEKHDERLRPLEPEEGWKPARERFKGFGGRGSWCR